VIASGATTLAIAERVDALAVAEPVSKPHAQPRWSFSIVPSDQVDSQTDNDASHADPKSALAVKRSEDEVLTTTAGPGCSMHEATFSHWQFGSVRFILGKETPPYVAYRLMGTSRLRDGSEHAFSDVRFYRIFALNCVRAGTPCQYLHALPHPWDDLPDDLGGGLWTADDGGSWWDNPRAPAPSWIRIKDKVFIRECPLKSILAFDVMLNGLENRCVESPALETFRKSAARLGPDGKWQPGEPVLPAGLEDLIGRPIIRPSETFSTISLAANGTFKGLRVVGVEIYNGHENGIVAFGVLFDASVPAVTKALGPTWTIEGTTVTWPDGSPDTYYRLYPEDGAVLAYCDWST
jgi:hypothetical protein